MTKMIPLGKSGLGDLIDDEDRVETAVKLARKKHYSRSVETKDAALIGICECTACRGFRQPGSWKVTK